MDLALLRKLGSEAFKSLKKIPLITEKVVNDVKVLSLFGDQYNFYFKDKIVWMKSEHHYICSSNFRLLTRHKQWQGILSFPRSFVAGIFDKGDLKGNTLSESKKLGTQYKIIVNQVYKADKNKLSRIIGGTIWKNLDRESACLSLKLFGITANSFDYSLINTNKEEVLDTVSKAVSILPIWKEISLLKIYASLNRRDAYDIAPSQILETISYHECDLRSPNIIETVKTELHKEGLTNAGWRYLLKLSPRSVQMIIIYHGSIARLVNAINALAKTGILPRYSVLKKTLHYISNHRDSEDFVAILRCGLEKSLKIRGVKNFYEQQFDLVIDWFSRNRNGVTLDHNQRKANWSWFMRKQAEWHRNHIVEQDIRKITKFSKWDCLLTPFEFKNHEVIPLTDSDALCEEGKAMQHCVSSYVNSCVSGKSHIFSIKRDKERVATLELRGENLQIAQCRGFNNASVSALVTQVAEEVSKRFIKAKKKLLVSAP